MRIIELMICFGESMRQLSIVSSRAALPHATQIIFPGPRRESLVRGKSRQLLLGHIKRLAMRDGHVRQLAKKGKLNRAQDRLLKAGSDYRVAVRAQQDRGAVF